MDLIDKHIKEQETIIEDVSVKADEEGFGAIEREAKEKITTLTAIRDAIEREAKEKITMLTAIRDEVERTMEPRTPESNTEYEKLMRLGTSKERGWVARWADAHSAAMKRVRLLGEKVEAYENQWEWVWYNDEDGTIVHDVKSPTQARDLIAMLVGNNRHLQAELRKAKGENRAEKEVDLS
jgi:hypothetical protein